MGAYTVNDDATIGEKDEMSQLQGWPIQRVIVQRGASCAIDHFLLRTKINFPMRESNIEAQKERLEKLEQFDERGYNTRSLEESTQILNKETPDMRN